MYEVCAPSSGQVREVIVRYARSTVEYRPGAKLTSPAEVVVAFQDMLLEPVEVFCVVLLDASNRIICWEEVARGTLRRFVVSPREIFWSAIHHRAAAVICVHSHPSGDAEPSGSDQALTQGLRDAGELLRIPLQDHIIVAHGGYYSFKEDGRI